jgi:uncharacterized protein YlxP (DUF503 family)
MVVGVLKLRLILPENHSLKGKRGVLRKIQSRVSHQFNISVTECGDQDLWQSGVLGFSVAGTSRDVVQGTLREVADFIEEMNLAQVSESETELFYC